ncbi:MAG: ROK family protein [Verrucomicrobia bacterium]|nr:ROK family protein [Verrucomicrobiota bacterium]
MPEPSRHYVGVDFGATKIYAGVFNASMKCIGTARFSTKAQRGPDAVIRRIGRCVQDAIDECDLDLKTVAGVGIGAPGAVDPQSGTVIFAPNLPDWRDIPLKEKLEKDLGVPIQVENDCNVNMLGVYEVELQSKPKHVFGIFLGTGIGGGIIINGQPYAGFNRAAGEVGHMVILVDGPECGCGNKGCFEALASRTAIFKQIKSAVKEGKKTILTDRLGKDLADLRSGDLRKAIRKGDKVVEKIIEDAARYTGVAVGNILNLFNPEVVVLGGGLIEALDDEMMPLIIKTARDHALPGTAKGIDIRACTLGDDAGITGGAVLARRCAKP